MPGAFQFYQTIYVRKMLNINFELRCLQEKKITIEPKKPITASK